MAAGLGSLLLGISLPSVASGTTVSNQKASAMLSTAVATATREGSVRVSVHFFSGKTTGELVEDSAAKSGKQTVAIGKGRVSIVLVDGTAYFSGNPQGLSSYFGMPSAVASTLVGKWVSVPPTDTGFQSVTAGLTLSSVLKEASPTGSIAEGKEKVINGRPTASVSGTGSASEPPTVLFIATKGKSLPVEAVASSGSGKTASGEIVTFSHWGEKVDVPTPAGAIPISSIPGSSGSG